MEGCPSGLLHIFLIQISTGRQVALDGIDVAVSG
jgi:hypothetical protein